MLRRQDPVGGVPIVPGLTLRWCEVGPRRLAASCGEDPEAHGLGVDQTSVGPGQRGADDFRGVGNVVARHGRLGDQGPPACVCVELGEGSRESVQGAAQDLYVVSVRKDGHLKPSWRVVKPRLRGRTFEVRFADDAVLAFEWEADARWVLAVKITLILGLGSIGAQ